MRDTTLYDLFIVYATDDLEWVEGSLIPALGISSERILTQELVRPGAEKVTEFERAVTSSRYTLLILSPAFLADTWTMYIASLASYSRVYSERDRLLPLRLKPCHIPLWIDALKLSFDCTVQSHRNAEIARLRQVLNQPEPPSLPRPCPYPGMRPFREDESHYFFGRDRDIQTLLDHLHNFPFVTIIGTSGSGKSSLVFAGLIPALKDGKLYQTQHWRICSMRPGETPFTTLQNLLGSDLSNPKDAVKNTLFIPPGAQKLLIVVDQFEELFILSESKEEEINRFQEILQHLIKIPDCLVVLTVRMDFYADLTRYPLLWKEIQQHRQEIVPLDHAGLRDAILKPAEQVGVFVETALVERLVADAAGEPGVLPLVQETLSLLWQGLERRFLPLHAYETLSRSNELFGVPNEGQLTGLQVAIARHADTTLNTLNETQQQIARRIFLRLVHFGEGRPDTRRQQPVKALHSTVGSPQEFNHTLEQLTVHRLLTRSGEEQTDEGYVDIAHDALIDGWPTLKDWIQKWKEAEQVKRRLEEKVAEWERLDRKGSLLDEKTFPEAEAWIHGPDAIILGYRSNLIEFIEDSRKAIERRRKSLRNWLILVTVIAIVAIGAAFGAYYGFRQATRNENLANQQKEVAQQERDNAIQQSIKALNQNSHSLFLSHDELGALFAGVKAGKSVKHFDVPAILHYETVFNLREIIYSGGVYERSRLEAHSTPVWSVSFSPDGKILASGSEDGVIKLWNVSTGEEIKTLPGHSDYGQPLKEVFSLAFNHDGTILVSGGRDDKIKFWDVSAGKEIRNFYHGDENDARGGVRSLTFSPNGKLLASGSEDSTIKLWDSTTGTEIAKFQGKGFGDGEGVLAIAFSPDGTMLASGSWVGIVKLWNIKDSEKTKTFNRKSDSVWSLSFHPDGRILAIGSTDGVIKLWDIKSNRQIKAWQAHSSAVWSLCFSPDGNILASGSHDNTIAFWNVKDWKENRRLYGHTDAINSISFNYDGTKLASGSADHTIRLWDRINNNRVKTLSGHSAFVNTVEFSLDGQFLASGSNDKTIKIWNVSSGQELKTLRGHYSYVEDVHFSSDNRLLCSVSTTNDGKVVQGSNAKLKLWDIEHGKEIKTICSNVLSAHFIQDSSQVVAILFYDLLTFWDTATLELLKKKKLPPYNSVVSVAFSEDGQIVAFGDMEGEIKLWNIQTGKEMSILQGHVATIRSLCFSSDKTLLASGDKNGTIKLWNVLTGNMIRKLKGHSESVESLNLSSDNTILASGSEDNIIKIWDTETGDEISSLIGHTHDVSSLAFSSDNKILASGSYDRTIKLWNLNLDDLLLRGCEWLQPYLKTTPNVTEEDRTLCDEILENQ